ncbi:hypothetical protein [Nostoc sp. 106C]|uniref:hypothetical protein n=1 Tax=Nostoc sp. 106C TaxID=1932667 RepID=UPI001412D098|nr:hypothetical protein [Nostoc sp. 106C]
MTLVLFLLSVLVFPIDSQDAVSYAAIRIYSTVGIFLEAALGLSGGITPYSPAVSLEKSGILSLTTRHNFYDEPLFKRRRQRNYEHFYYIILDVSVHYKH